MIICVCKVYVVNFKSWKKTLDPRMSTYPWNVFGPINIDYIPHQDDGYLMLLIKHHKVTALLWSTKTSSEEKPLFLL